MSSSRFHALVVLCLSLVAAVFHSNAQGQTQIDFTTDVWVPNLPNYHAGSVVTQGVGTLIQPNIFENDQTDAGLQFGIQGFRPIGDTCFQIEFDANFAWSNPSAATMTFNDPGPTQTIWFASLDGLSFLATGAGESATFALDSDVIHYNEFIGLRRSRFCTSRGVVDVGVGFSHMAYEQDMALNVLFSNGSVGQYLENLDTDFFGGEIRSSFTQEYGGRPVILDLNVGLYEMEAQYAGVSNRFNGAGVNLGQVSASGVINAFATTVDVRLRTEWTVWDVLVRPGIGFKYISHMPLINHPQTIISATPVSFDTDYSYIITASLEVMLRAG